MTLSDPGRHGSRADSAASANGASLRKWPGTTRTMERSQFTERDLVLPPSATQERVENNFCRLPSSAPQSGTNSVPTRSVATRAFVRGAVNTKIGKSIRPVP